MKTLRFRAGRVYLGSALLGLSLVVSCGGDDSPSKYAEGGSAGSAGRPQGGTPPEPTGGAAGETSLGGAAGQGGAVSEGGGGAGGETAEGGTAGSGGEGAAPEGGGGGAGGDEAGGQAGEPSGGEGGSGEEPCEPDTERCGEVGVERCDADGVFQALGTCHGDQMECGPCLNGDACSDDDECSSGVCGSGGLCTPPSCVGLADDVCEGESCCTSLFVPGGTYERGRGSETCDTCVQGCPSIEGDCEGATTDERPEHRATIAGFELDKYEVTVGRFRRFYNAYPGSKPVRDDGAHPLVFGSGWQDDWVLPVNQVALEETAACDQNLATWTHSAGDNEALPMNCTSWFMAFAFCAWDGGRLPTEAEWEYAAAGGSEDRLYPWGDASPDASLAVYDCNGSGTPGTCTPADILPVGSIPDGGARWGHQDLAGSMWEWVLDWHNIYHSTDCTNDTCVSLDEEASTEGIVVRGGSWQDLPTFLRAADRDYRAPTVTNPIVGFRCARSP